MIGTGFALFLLSAQPGCEFYAFDNAAGRGKVPYEKTVDIIREAGFRGVGYEGAENVQAVLVRLDSAGLKMCATYLSVDLSRPAVESWREGIAALRGRGTILELSLMASPRTSQLAAWRPSVPWPPWRVRQVCRSPFIPTTASPYLDSPTLWPL
jgi:hypothetical protein